MRVTVSSTITHLCPHVDERDIGVVEASWDGDAVELHHFADIITSLADWKITHEQVTAFLADWLRIEGAQEVEVSTQWTTAGLGVVCQA